MQKIVVLVNWASSISQIQLIAHPINTIVAPFSKSDPVILIIYPPASDPFAGDVPSTSVTLVTGIM